MESTTVQQTKTNVKQKQSTKTRKRRLSNAQILEYKEKRKALNSKLKELNALIPPPQVKAHTKATRSFNVTAMNDLLSLSKTSKVVVRLLKTAKLEGFVKMLSEAQLKKGVNESQYNQLLKSPTLVIKMFTDSEFQKFVSSGNKVTPTAYLNVIKKAATMAAHTFKARKDAKARK